MNGILVEMQQLIGVQYLRGIAALGVLFFHSAERLGYETNLGPAGVDLFFVISGFLMAAITGDEGRPLHFLGDRVRRIVPLYWVATSVVLAGAVAGVLPSVALAPWHIASSYLFIPSYSPSDGGLWPLLVPGWTLNYEMFFYVSFALLMVFRSQKKQIMAMTFGFIGLVLIGKISSPTSAPAVAYTDPIILEFVAGSWIGLLWKQRRSAPGWAGWLLIGTAAAMLLAAGIANTSEMRLVTFGLPMALLLAGVLILERQERIARWRLPLLLGDASYSIYLWHGLAISLAVKIGERFALTPVTTGTLAFAGGTLAGVTGYMLVERPLMRLFRARRTKKGVPNPGGP